jgi:hypothetical protein
MKKDNRIKFTVVFTYGSNKYTIIQKAFYAEEAIVLAIDIARNSGKGFNAVEAIPQY